ncbi:MAG: GntR family transcriptional regulator, transcriptional repressor for pyruvate dehydrogenase complex [Actinomycetota bacterium]|jgi:DNA-binding FadR family transcriptional regulator|nr:GntR family transcriptional regulator, transcriptional repressor for pyruvate dehydrogenase complex [Actinomycetota bacterium]
MTMSQPPGKLYRGRVADQIVEDLRKQIFSGELADGARLPSERELAAYYDVSAPTVREAIRVLTAVGLLSTRNGSRSTVTAKSDTLLAMSIASVVQFEKMAAADVFGLLGVLNSYAVELAVDRASEEDIAELRAAAEQAGGTAEAELAPETLLQYFVTLSAISHNPLLAALCRFITQMQIGLAVELARANAEEWGRVPASLHKARMDIVDAIAQRDAPRAVQLVGDYHRKVAKRIQASPGAKKLRGIDPGLTTALSSWLGTNVGLGSDLDRRSGA